MRHTRDGEFTHGQAVWRRERSTLSQRHGRSSCGTMSKRFLLLFLLVSGVMGSVACGGSRVLAGPPKRQDAFQYDAKERRDPFVALVWDGKIVGASASRPEVIGSPVAFLLLAGIMWDPAGR